LFGGRRRTPFGAGATIEVEAPPENVLVACLGPSFAELPEVVQRAHRGTVRLSGAVTVERGGGLGALIAMALRLPRSSRNAELVVVAWHFDDQMIWSRTFDGRTFESTFRREGDFLVERRGPVALLLAPKAEGGRLVYRLAAARLGPVALPRALCPTLDAWEGERDGTYVFDVAVALPLIGRVIRYSGSLELEVLAAS
jgi:hypothetical protein